MTTNKELQNQQTTSLWIDMDGVLNKITSDDYAPNVNSSSIYSANFAKDGYFLNRPENPHMMNFLKYFLASDNKRVIRINFDTHILANVSKLGSLYVRQRKDKKAWLKNQCEEYAIQLPHDMCYNSVHFQCGSKVDYATQYLGRELTRKDILIDDFNTNLIEWENRGGTAIKYLNTDSTCNLARPEMHHPEAVNFYGLHIDQAMTSQEISEMLCILQNPHYI